jgi:hypothetical protein
MGCECNAMLKVRVLRSVGESVNDANLQGIFTGGCLRTETQSFLNVTSRFSAAYKITCLNL